MKQQVTKPFARAVFLAVLALTLLPLTITAQGLGELVRDSTMAKLIKKHRVKRIQEWHQRQDNRFVNTIYGWDANGHINEIVQAGGNRHTFVNDKNGNKLIMRYHQHKDTSVVESEVHYKYDSEGRVIEEQGVVDGKVRGKKTITYKAPRKTKYGTSVTSIHYENGKPTATVTVSDSATGKLKFATDYTVSAPYRSDGMPEIKMYVVRIHESPPAEYSYIIYGNLRNGKREYRKVDAYYTLRDAKNRETEWGRYEYGESIYPLIQANPSFMTYDGVHPELLRMMLSGTARGEREKMRGATYDAEGRKITEDYNGKSTYTYNNDGQVSTVTIANEEHTSTEKRFYNEKGLLTRMEGYDADGKLHWAVDFVYDYHP